MVYFGTLLPSVLVAFVSLRIVLFRKCCQLQTTFGQYAHYIKAWYLRRCTCGMSCTDLEINWSPKNGLTTTTSISVFCKHFLHLFITILWWPSANFGQYTMGASFQHQFWYWKNIIVLDLVWICYSIGKMAEQGKKELLRNVIASEKYMITEI